MEASAARPLARRGSCAVQPLCARRARARPRGCGWIAGLGHVDRVRGHAPEASNQLLDTHGTPSSGGDTVWRRAGRASRPLWCDESGVGQQEDAPRGPAFPALTIPHSHDCLPFDAKSGECWSRAAPIFTPLLLVLPVVVVVVPRDGKPGRGAGRAVAGGQRAVGSRGTPPAARARSAGRRGARVGRRAVQELGGAAGSSWEPVTRGWCEAASSSQVVRGRSLSGSCRCGSVECALESQLRGARPEFPRVGRGGAGRTDGRAGGGACAREVQLSSSSGGGRAASSRAAGGAEQSCKPSMAQRRAGCD